ncbi:hypothetical protein [Pseudonocardia sp. ICBG601]|nr:hypothetical protein [Pseudonocardia sp. ICBG601]
MAGRLGWLAAYPSQRFVFAVMARTLAGVAETRYRREVRAL